MEPKGEIQTARYKIRTGKDHKNSNVIFISKEGGEGFEISIHIFDYYLDEFFDENM